MFVGSVFRSCSHVDLSAREEGGKPADRRIEDHSSLYGVSRSRIPTFSLPVRGA